MRRAEDIIIGCEHDGSYIPVNEVLRLIKLAQLETIEETCRICAEKATGSVYNIPGPGDLKRVSINKQSILNCAEILKKEL